MIPTNIPPEVNRPVQIETIKDLLLRRLIACLNFSIELYRKAQTTHKIKEKNMPRKADMIHRVLFLDLLNTKNREQLLKFDVVKEFFPPTETFPPIPTNLPKGNKKPFAYCNVSINEYFRMGDIRTYVEPFNRFYGNLKTGFWGVNIVDLSYNLAKDSRYSRLPKCMHHLIAALYLRNFPEPEFADFTRIPREIPIRLENGEPNDLFFNQWYDNCVSYVDGE